MTLHEALTLCKDHGYKVRPKAWRFLRPGCRVVFVERSGEFRETSTGDAPLFALSLTTPGELLGEWEIVE